MSLSPFKVQVRSCHFWSRFRSSACSARCWARGLESVVCVGVSVGGMAPTYVPVSIAEEESQALTGPSATPSRLQHFYSTLRRPGIKTLILSSVVLQNTCYALVRRYSRGALHEKASLAQPPFFVDTESRAARRTYPIFLSAHVSSGFFSACVYIAFCTQSQVCQ